MGFTIPEGKQSNAIIVEKHGSKQVDMTAGAAVSALVLNRERQAERMHRVTSLNEKGGHDRSQVWPRRFIVAMRARTARVVWTFPN